jgi:serine/threonine protein phosphatase PrpC
MLASDGVFDKMSNEDISRGVWESCDKNKWQSNPAYKPAQSVHQQCGLAVESVLKNSLYRQSLDNVTVVMIAFQNFKRQVFGKSKNSEREELAAEAGISTTHHQSQTISKQFSKKSISIDDSPSLNT